MIASCVYAGEVRHRRHEPVQHELAYPIAMLYVDHDELPELFDGHPLWSARRPAPGRLRAGDHLEAETVRDLVEERTGARPEGPVRLLTRPRCFGHAFNPVSFSFAFDAAGERVDAVVAEVTNTPWGERHAYVVEGTEAELDKAFHVSPFLGMEHRYAVRVTEPGDRLAVHIRAGATFDATLTLRRRALDRAGLRRLLWQAPTRPRIYAQALRLKLKGAPYFPHPKGAAR